MKNSFIGAVFSAAILLMSHNVYGVLSEFEPELQYPSIIPRPVSQVYGEGYFTLCPGTRVVAGDEVEFDLQHYLNVTIRRAFPERWTLPLAKEYNEIELAITKDVKRAEGYRIDVSAGRVAIRGRDKAGLYYGIQTFLQLLPPDIYTGREIGGEYYIPAQTIEDWPKFAYRGMMLDVARTFQSKEQVKRHLDRMAAHKLNKLHFHLTDDEGWRIELDSYPRLAHQGGFRGGDSPVKPIYGGFDRKYGGYFTKQDLSEIVSYAAFRNIEIIPEIDLPGHSRAAAKVHPEILCAYTYNGSLTAGDDRRNVWCAARDQNYVMLEKIIKEIAAIFPSKYFHIGGDEVAYGQWKTCPKCKELMKEKGYDEAADLEDYFISKVGDIVRRQGKIPFVWDEAIKRDSLASDAVVSAWSGVQALKDATEKEYYTVAMPGPYFYIDMRQAPEEDGQTWAGVVPTERLYSFGLDRIGLDKDQKKYVRGVEAAFFSELLLSHDYPYFEYMTWPRMAALAEVGWTDESRRDWTDFRARLHDSHLDRLRAMGINYRLDPPVVDYSLGILTATVPLGRAEIRYTSDGSDPTLSSPLYTAPFEADEAWDYAFRAFYDGIESAVVRPKAIRTVSVGAKRQATIEIPIAEMSADSGLWYIRARTPGIDFLINRLSIAGTAQTQTLVARGQSVNDLHLLRWYLNDDNLDGKISVTVTNRGPFAAELMLELSKSPYIQPEVKVTSSLKQNNRFPFKNIEDYNFTTYTRTSATCKEGDWFTYTFTEPVDAASIEVVTGLSYMPRYHIPTGRVQHSADGVNFADAATLTEGRATVYPQGEIKALKIVSDSHGNSEAAVALQDLKIRPRK